MATVACVWGRAARSGRISRQRHQRDRRIVKQRPDGRHLGTDLAQALEGLERRAALHFVVVHVVDEIRLATYGDVPAWLSALGMVDLGGQGGSA